MSRFFQALERAEHEQALRRQTTLSEPPGERHSMVASRMPSSTSLCAPELPPVVSEGLDEHLVSLVAPASFEAEQYRALRHRIEQLHKSVDLSVLAVSSPGVADGKTTTAINLAGALAQAPDARVLLVDADLRGPALRTRLGLDHTTGHGLVDAILDPALSLAAVVHTRADLNLSVLTSGRLPAAPYEVLKAVRFGELLAEARRQFDYVVLDTPPLVSVPDCRVIGKWVDGFLVVVTAHRTARKLLEEALNVTELAKIVGLVFNGDDRHLSRSLYASNASGYPPKRNGRRPSTSDD